MYKMLVLDFDDTLFSDDRSISAKNIQAIQKAKDQGITILFCSGRSDESMIQFIHKMGTYEDHEYFASYNGGLISTIDGQQIFKKVVEKDILSGLVDLGHSFNIDVQCYQEKLIVEKITELTHKYMEMTKTKCQVVDSLKMLEESVKVLFYSEDLEKLELLKQSIEKKYDQVCNIFYSKPTYVEVLNKEASKGLAVQYLGSMLGIAQEEIIAVGDSFNDISMIEYAGLGVAVANARIEVKQIADFITLNDNNHDAIAEVIEKFILK